MVVEKARIALEETAEFRDDLSRITWTPEQLYRIDHDPGRFEGEPQLAKVLFELLMNGGSGEGLGDMETGWYERFDAVELTGITKPIYAILSSTSTGFLHVEEFPNEKKLEKAWGELERAFEPYYREE
jgi:hypothetical protein